MPFDPAQPANNSALSSQVMREQLTSLKALIDAIAAITAAQVDGVSTGNPGDPAAASVVASSGTLHFTFTIPRGDEGVQGQPGIQGPPFANAVIDAVNTLPAGSAAEVSVSFDGTNVHFTFGIPRGNDGAQGPPGEVTNAQLSSAISGTSNNTNGVSTLGQTADSNYNPQQMQDVLNKLDEFLNAARR